MSTTLLDLPTGSRTPTSTNPSSPPEETDSGPGTPASGISFLSTTAIKDGHPGHHPEISLDIAADRVARLGGLGPPNISSSYFDRDRTTPSSSSNLVPNTASPAATISSTFANPPTPSASSAFSDGRTTPEGDTYGANSTQAKRESMAAVIARRRLEGQVGLPVGEGGLSSGDGSQTSVATTQTSSSAAAERDVAKYTDGMTYDEGDTTGVGLKKQTEDDIEMSG